MEWKITKFVFVMFRDNLFIQSQSYNFLSSVFIFFSKSFKLSDSIVSSAKRKKLSFLEMLGRSLIYIRNNRGSSTEPCGTPHVTYLVSEFTPLIKTNCFLSVR